MPATLTAPGSTQRARISTGNAMADQPSPQAARPAGRMPRRHHFIPQFYLAGFTDSGQRDGSLWILNREDGLRWQGTPASVAHERDFYRVDDVEGVAVSGGLKTRESGGRSWRAGLPWPRRAA
jgi:hypothetical protein